HEEHAVDPSARGTGRRRFLSQRRQALELAGRPGMADPEGVGGRSIEEGAMTTRRMLRTTATGRQPQRTRTALDNFSAISARSAVAVAAAPLLLTPSPPA